MRIGITCYPTYGGSGIVATELGIELAERGHEIHFITYANPIRLSVESPRLHYHEVEVADYPLFQYPPYCLALASRMAEVAESAKLDLLHVHYAIPHSISALLASQMLDGRLPFITTLHGTDVTLVGNDPSYFPITSFAIERSPGVTTISEYLRKRTVDVFGVKNPIRVIPNFVNCDLYQVVEDAALRAQYAPPDEKILMHLSNLRPVKRPLDCVRILARLVEHVPARLLMVGDGPERSAAETLARELGVEDKVEFLGKRLQVAPLLAIADIFLLPSEMEGFGLAALEAMACGVPAVASNVGGVPELITDSVDGVLCPVGDIDAMAQACRDLLTDSECYKSVAGAARETALTRFCATKIIPLYEDYYREIRATPAT
jgi:N-acetyl-alpha-D-glucosaminyl L-malate synthase BshA